MKRLFVMSDSHRGTGMLELTAEHIAENRYDMLIHLGDVCRDAEWLEQQLGRQVISVPGNCDFFSHEAREEELFVENVKILLTHGDGFGVKTGLDRLSYYAEERGCQLALFGHTHSPFSGYVGKSLLVNPGALLDGRAALIEIDGERIIPASVRVQRADAVKITQKRL